MKLQLHPDYPGDEWTGAIGTLPFAVKRGEVFTHERPEVNDALSKLTWRARFEREDAPGKWRYEQLPIFEEVAEAPLPTQGSTPDAASHKRKKAAAEAVEN